MREFSDDSDTPSGQEHAGAPRFGRLLLVLLAAVLIIVLITFGSEAYFS